MNRSIWLTLALAGLEDEPAVMKTCSGDFQERTDGRNYE